MNFESYSLCKFQVVLFFCFLVISVNKGSKALLVFHICTCRLPPTYVTSLVFWHWNYVFVCNLNYVSVVFQIMYFEDQNLCKYQVVPRNILFSYQIGQQWEPSGQILSSHNSSFCKVKKSKGTLNAHVCIYGCLSSVFFQKSKRTLFVFMFLCLWYFCFQKNQRDLHWMSLIISVSVSLSY